MSLGNGREGGGGKGLNGNNKTQHVQRISIKINKAVTLMYRKQYCYSLFVVFLKWPCGLVEWFCKTQRLSS